MVPPGVGIVGFVSCQHRPTPPGVLVGDGEQGFVIADAGVQSCGPQLQTRAFLGGSFQSRLQRGSGPLGEQARQIGITALGDDAKALAVIGPMPLISLTRCAASLWHTWTWISFSQASMHCSSCFSCS